MLPQINALHNVNIKRYCS